MVEAGGRVKLRRSGAVDEPANETSVAIKKGERWHRVQQGVAMGRSGDIALFQDISLARRLDGPSGSCIRPLEKNASPSGTCSLWR